MLLGAVELDMIDKILDSDAAYINKSNALSRDVDLVDLALHLIPLHYQLILKKCKLTETLLRHWYN